MTAVVASPSAVRRPGGVDYVLAVALWVGTTVYLTRFPHNLGATDESLFLYEAKRILEGQVMYRDFFEIVSPISWYFVALTFHLFGADMTTARTTTAILGGSITALTYLGCRTAGVRHGFAIGAGLAFVALSQQVWPYASPHWYSTLVTTLLLLLLLRGGWATRTASLAMLGVVGGVAVGVQQQKGVVLCGGLGLIVIADFLISRRWSPQPWQRLWTQVGVLIAGFLAIVIPLSTALVVAAGSGPVVKALIEYPLVNYRQNYRSAWAGVGVLSLHYAEYTYPMLFKLLPSILVIIVARAAYDCWRMVHRDELRRLTVLAIWCVTSMLSIAYYPDFIHVAFITPVFYVAIAESLDWGVQRTLGTRLPQAARFVGVAVSAALIVFCVWRMDANLERTRMLFPIAHETAFGRIDFTDNRSIRVIDVARENVQKTPGAELFCYPGLTSPYLLTGGNNPTPYQMLTPAYSGPAQLAEVIAILEARKTKNVITSGLFAGSREDPVLNYIREHYEYIPVGGIPPMWLYQRKDIE